MHNILQLGCNTWRPTVLSEVFDVEPDPAAAHTCRVDTDMRAKPNATVHSKVTLERHQQMDAIRRHCRSLHLLAVAQGQEIKPTQGNTTSANPMAYSTKEYKKSRYVYQD